VGEGGRRGERSRPGTLNADRPFGESVRAGQGKVVHQNINCGVENPGRGPGQTTNWFGKRKTKKVSHWGTALRGRNPSSTGSTTEDELSKLWSKKEEETPEGEVGVAGTGHSFSPWGPIPLTKRVEDDCQQEIIVKEDSTGEQGPSSAGSFENLVGSFHQREQKATAPARFGRGKEPEQRVQRETAKQACGQTKMGTRG